MPKKKTTPRKGTRSRQTREVGEDLEDVGQVALARFGDMASLVPTSMLRATEDQAEAVQHLHELAERIRELEHAQLHAVHVARSHGVSWEVVGWASGITGRGASLRWGSVDR